MIVGIVALFVMAAANKTFADGGCNQPPGSDPCGCNAAQCNWSAQCEATALAGDIACGILGPIDGCDEAVAISEGLCEAAGAAAWAGCTAGCS